MERLPLFDFESINSIYWKEEKNSTPITLFRQGPVNPGRGYPLTIIKKKNTFPQFRRNRLGKSFS